MTEQSETEQALRNKIEINLLYFNEQISNVRARAGVIVDFIKEAFPELAKEAGYVKLGKFDFVIQKPVTGLPQVGQFTPEEYVPILGYIPPEPHELTGFPGDRYRTAEGRKTILEDVQRARKAKADWLALPLERKVGLEQEQEDRRTEG